MAKSKPVSSPAAALTPFTVSFDQDFDGRIQAAAKKLGFGNLSSALRAALDELTVDTVKRAAPARQRSFRLSRDERKKIAKLAKVARLSGGEILRQAGERLIVRAKLPAATKRANA